MISASVFIVDYMQFRLILTSDRPTWIKLARLTLYGGYIVTHADHHRFTAFSVEIHDKTAYRKTCARCMKHRAYVDDDHENNVYNGQAVR